MAVRGGHVASVLMQGGEQGGGGCCRAVGEGAEGWYHLQPEDIRKVHVNTHVNRALISFAVTWHFCSVAGQSVGRNPAPQLAVLLHSLDLSMNHVFLDSSLFLCKNHFSQRWKTKILFTYALHGPTEQEH